MHLKPTYRYAPKKYNDNLNMLGGIRIGTLHDFRKNEHKKGIVDVDEGIKHVSHKIDNLHIEDSNDPNIVENIDYKALSEFKAIDIGPNAKNISLQNITVSRKFDEPDLFVLCSSKFKSKETMECFDGADSCIEITHPINFYKELTNTLNYFVPVDFKGYFEVKYQNRQEVWNGRDWGKSPALIKGLEYTNQGEIRAIWKPLNATDTIQPLIIGSYRLGEWVKSIKL